MSALAMLQPHLQLELGQVAEHREKHSSSQELEVEWAVRDCGPAT